MGSKATREELGDLGVVYARLFEFVKNGKRPAGRVIAGMQALADGQFSEDGRFDRYNHLLLSLDEQMELLRRYNTQYWDNRLTDDDFSLVYSGADLEHTQRVDDLNVLHVEFDSPEETVEMWWRVMVGEQPKNWRWDELKLDPEHLRVLGCNTKSYEPGIHLVRINLVAHWEPEDGRTIKGFGHRPRKPVRHLLTARSCRPTACTPLSCASRTVRICPTRTCLASRPRFPARTPGRACCASTGIRSMAGCG
jgi:hypothetical protein